MKKIILTIILALLLSACGQTGKLVLPNSLSHTFKNAD
ncbi:MAG: lipoprotein [Methylococcaceae bacterium]